MIKLFIVYIIIFLAAVLLGLPAGAKAGYVFLVLHHTQIAMPLWLAGVSLLFLFLLSYWLIDLLRFVKNIPTRFLYYRQKKREEKNRQQMKEAVFLMIQGQYLKAEKAFLKLAKQNDFKSLYYICAAITAHKQSNVQMQQEYLYRASRKAQPVDEFVISLLQAKFYVEDEKQDAALMILNRLRQVQKTHPAVIGLLKTVYEKLDDWESLEKLLPVVRSAHFLSQQDFNTFQDRVYSRLLQESADIQCVRKIWKRLPTALRLNESVFIAYVKRLREAGLDDEASALIAKILTKRWSDELVVLFGECKTHSAESQLRQADKWLKTQPNNAVLLLSLGKIAMRLNNWIRANEYVFQSLNLKQTSEAYQLLSIIYEHQGEMQQALNACRRGAVL